jgi:hypothetical protein
MVTKYLEYFFIIYLFNYLIYIVLVKCFGSEDRIKEEYKKIPANPTILPFVTFPGNEIKDLSVFESDDEKPSKELKSTEPRTTTNPKSSNTSEQNKNPRPRSDNRPSNLSKPRNDTKPTNQQSSKPQNQNRPTRQSHQHEAPPKEREPRKAVEKSASVAGTGEHLARLRLRKGNDQGGDTAEEDLKDEFDFQASLSTFNKTEVLKTVASESMPIAEAKYVKDDFFDMLSSDATAEGRVARSTQNERALNQDTFGAIAVQQNYRRGGGGYRGRGRGGRGERGGRGRSTNRTSTAVS